MEYLTQIHKNGRIVLPARLRKALDLQTGDEIIMRLEDGSIRLIPLRQAVELAQKTVRKYVSADISLVDELIQARRRETE